MTRATDFLALHVPGKPLLIPNPWDIGSAKVLVSLGFKALATTSSGFAATLGKADGAVGRDAALAHGQALAAAVDVPVSADLENCFADEPAGVAATVEAARDSGLAGCSVEDFSGKTIYDRDLAVERIAAAAQAAHAGDGLVLTARAENFIRANPDLDDTIARLRAFADAGADVVYAPGLTTIDQVRRVVEAVERPVNVLAVPALPGVHELAAAGVARISIGGTFSAVAFGALAQAGRELIDHGSFGFFDLAKEGHAATRAAFS